MAGYDEELGNSVFFEKGMHATSILGTMASAASAARPKSIAEDEIVHAIAISASMGAGIIEANRTGGTVKRIHCGWAAHSGVVAAEFARRGLTGPPTVFEGRFGFLQAYLDERSNPKVITNKLGEKWELLERFFFKPYPTNHFTHAGIDAALELRAAGLKPEEIEEVELGVAAPVMRTIAEPPEKKARPETAYAAQFSGPFTFAVAMRGGGGLGVYLDDFTERAIGDEKLLDLASRVRVVEDAECSRIFPHQFPAVARVRTKSGKFHQIRVLENRGGPQRPLDNEELSEKFRTNARRVLRDQRVTNLIREIENLETLSRAQTLLEETVLDTSKRT